METHLDELEKNRRLAIMQREIAITTKKIGMDEMSHASRWIMASALAINSDGLIACLGKIDQLTISSIGATIAFYSGVALAMMAGWSQVKTIQQMLPFHSRFIAAWEMAAIDGVIDEEELKETAAQMFTFARRASGLPSKLNKLSFFAFSAGLIFLATSVGAKTDSNTPANLSAPE